MPMATLDELVLAKLVELARNPTVQQLEIVRAENVGLRRDNDRMQKELLRKLGADGPLTELWQAAEAAFKSMPPIVRKEKKFERLADALKAASPFVDQIPF